jgi:hypothetical protein
MHGARFGVFQVALGAALLAAAGALSGPAWVVAWPAVSVGLVGLGYLGLGPRVFGKREDGSISLPHLVVLLPYHVVAWARLRWDALRRAEDPWNEVAPGIFLGRRLTDLAELPPGTTAVIDMTAEFRAMPGLAPRLAYRTLPTLDASAPEYASFASLARWAAAHQGPLYVHCAAGHGRSAALAAAVLVLRGHARDGAAAEERLKRARPLVHLHRPQRALVDRLASEVGSAP